MNKIKTFLLAGIPEQRIANVGLLVLRLAVALPLGLTHGWNTFSGLLENGGGNYPDPLGLGSAATMALMGFAEFFCALAVALGIFTRLSVLPLVIGFFVAVFIHHSGDTFGQKETAWLYFWAFSTILLLGPGRYSIDGWLIKK